MKNKLTLNDLMLSLIAIMIAIIGFFAKKSYDQMEGISKALNETNISNEKAHSLLRTQIELINSWTHQVYESEIKSNTERSSNNEKRIYIIEGKLK